MCAIDIIIIIIILSAMVLQGKASTPHLVADWSGVVLDVSPVECAPTVRFPAPEIISEKFGLTIWSSVRGQMASEGIWDFTFKRLSIGHGMVSLIKWQWDNKLQEVWSGWA